MNNAKTVVSFLLLAAGLSVAVSARADTVKRISQRDGPVLQGDSDSRYPQISANGNFVAFYSSAGNLPPNGPASNSPMILVKNLTTDTISWQSQRGDFELPPLSNPRPIGGITSNIALTNTGQAIWENSSDNFTGFDPCPDSNGFSDIYKGTYSPTLSSSPGGFCGIPGNGDSFRPATSGNSALVAFESNANNFTGVVDTNAKRDVYVKNLATGVFTRTSLINGGAQTNGDSFRPSLSTTGEFTAFASLATNIVNGDTNGAMDVFVGYRVGPAFVAERVSVSNFEAQANGASDNPSISGDGRYVAFTSTATNLVTADSNGVQDIFVRDRTIATTRRVSFGTGSLQANGASFNPVISADGRYIAFSSDATNLVVGDSNGVRDVFLFDQHTFITTRLSVTSTLAQANAASDYPSISADGLRIAYSSAATNIIPGDSNGRFDVFMYTITPSPPNDSCGSAVAIGLGDTMGTTTGALANGTSSCGFSITSPDVYFTFTPTRTAFVQFETTAAGNFDTVISLHSACPATLANQLACDDDSNWNDFSKIALQPVTAGVPIIVRVTGFNGLSGDFTLRLSEVAPPNDLCSAPNVLALNVEVQGTNVVAGTETTVNCQNSQNDVFYKFTPTCTATYSIDTTGTLDTVLSIHSACPATLNNVIACDDDNGPGRLSHVDVALTANTAYFIRVAGFNGLEGGFGLIVGNNDVLNDECAAATPVTAGPHPFNNCAAMPVDSGLNICGVPAGHDLWYTYTSTDSNLPITIATVGIDTVLAVYTGCPGSGGTQIACNDDFVQPFRGSLIRLNAAAGTTLTIQVAGWSSVSGSGTLSISNCLADIASADGPFPDGIVDGNDFIAFINSFGIGDAAESPVADVNGDSIIDGNDFVAYINAFAAGC